MDLFAEKDTGLYKNWTTEMKIDTADHLPIKLEPYWTPFVKWHTFSKATDEMLTANIICQSKCPWCFPVAVATKKVGSYTFCTDSWCSMLSPKKKLLAITSHSWHGVCFRKSKVFHCFGFEEWILANSIKERRQRKDSIFVSQRFVWVQSHTIWVVE